MDKRDLYLLEDLEKYLFYQVRNSFQNNGRIDAFDFFCIIIWKANRAKTAIAKKIREKGKLKRGIDNLDILCRSITEEIYKKHNDPEEQLRYLLKEWGFRLPTASSILTVFYPDYFTVYDTRVCGTFPEFRNLDNLSASKIETKIDKYFEFVNRVREYAGYPRNDMSLRDKDRYLWGKSFHDDLEKDIRDGFPKRGKDNV
jgi:hypothetical protein